MSSGQKTRNTMIDIFKAIAIISVVVGHTPMPRSVIVFVYSYHLCAFFFASGFTFKKEYVSDRERAQGYIGRLVLKNIALFIGYSILFIGAHNAFVHMGILSDATYSIKNVLSGILLSVSMYYTEPFLGAFWFVPVMIAALIIFVLSIQLAHNIADGPITEVILMAVYVATALISYKNEVRVQYFLQVALLALPVIFAGYLVKEYYKIIEQYIVVPVGIIAGCLIMGILTATGEEISLGSNKIISLGWFYPVTFLGLYYCLSLAKWIDRGPLKRLFVFIGKNTYHIMALHFLGFKLMDFCYAKICGVQESAILGAFPTSGFFPGILYSAGSLMFCLAVVYVAGNVKSCALQKISLRSNAEYRASTATDFHNQEKV